MLRPLGGILENTSRQMKVKVEFYSRQKDKYVFNVYIVLKSPLGCLMIDSSYEDTLIFIFRVWVFADYIISSNN